MNRLPRREQKSNSSSYRHHKSSHRGYQSNSYGRPQSNSSHRQRQPNSSHRQRQPSNMGYQSNSSHKQDHSKEKPTRSEEGKIEPEEKKTGLEVFSDLKITPEIIADMLGKVLNGPVSFSAATGTGKTVGIPMYTLYKMLTDPSFPIKRLFVSIPLRAAAKGVYEYILSKVPHTWRKYIALGCEGNKSSNFRTAKIVFGTTQTIMNTLVSLYNKSINMTGVMLMIDETHCPTVENYGMMGVANLFLEQKVPIKVLLTTATPDSLPFPHLAAAKKITMGQNQHPIEVKFLNKEIYSIRPDGRITGNLTHIEKKCLEILCDVANSKSVTGNILVFVPGSKMALSLEEKASKILGHGFVTYSFFGTMSTQDKDQVMVPDPHVRRKVIFATTAVQSGVTLPDVNAVIDIGLWKTASVMQGGQKFLVMKCIPKDAATQRKGRTGRNKPGLCIRLYTESQFHNIFPDHIESQFHRQPPHPVVMEILKDGLPANQVLMIPDDEYKVILSDLHELGIIDMKTNEMTRLGHRVSRLPLYVKLATILCQAQDGYSPENDCDDGKEFYKLLMTAIVVSLIDHHLSNPFPYNIPKNILRNRNETLEYILGGRYDRFVGDNDISVIVKIFIIMICECFHPSAFRNDKRQFYKNMRDWAREESLQMKYLKGAFLTFSQVWNRIMGNSGLDLEDFETIRENHDYLMCDVARLLRQAYSSEQLECKESSPNTYIDPATGEWFRVNNRSIATCWRREKPCSIVPICVNVIENPGKPILRLLSLAIPLEKDRPRH